VSTSPFNVVTRAGPIPTLSPAAAQSSRTRPPSPVSPLPPCQVVFPARQRGPRNHPIRHSASSPPSLQVQLLARPQTCAPPTRLCNPSRERRVETICRKPSTGCCIKNEHPAHVNPRCALIHSGIVTLRLARAPHRALAPPGHQGTGVCLQVRGGRPLSLQRHTSRGWRVPRSSSRMGGPRNRVHERVVRASCASSMSMSCCQCTTSCSLLGAGIRPRSLRRRSRSTFGGSR
jgi:hypothetical protein